MDKSDASLENDEIIQSLIKEIQTTLDNFKVNVYTNNNKKIDTIENSPSLSDSEISALREEIRLSHNTRMDLFKFKMIAIGGLGAVGLGIGVEYFDNFHFTPYILCLLPLICLMIDALCHHNLIRILMLGEFLKSRGDRYETFIEERCQTGKYYKLRCFDEEDTSLVIIKKRTGQAASNQAIFYKKVVR